MTLNNYQNIASSIVGVLVLYKSTLEESSTFQTLTESLKKLEITIDLVIYDNSPVKMISESHVLQNEQWMIHYIHDSTNPGVSKAYNEGAKIGQKLNKKWILLLDQDTKFPPDIFKNYFNALEASQLQNLFAPYLFEEDQMILLSPSGYKFKRGFPLKSDRRLIPSGINSLDGKTLLSSGLLIKLAVFQDLGGYNENLRLDFSDFYFIDKFRKLYPTFYLIESQCFHGLSRLEETSIEKSVIRFSICCEAIHHFPENRLGFIQVTLYLLLRSFKLSLENNSFVFQKILYTAIFKLN